MSQVLTIDNRDYIPASQVGKHFGYTRDYILMLARDGKIDGRKIGHRWFINFDSAETFFRSAQAEREERRQAIRAVRKEELRSFEVKRKKSTKVTRKVEVLAILVVGLIIASAGVVGTNTISNQTALSYASDAPFLEKLAVSLYNFISPDPQESASVSSTSESSLDVDQVSTSNSQNVAVDDEDVVATRTVHTSLVIGSGEVFTTTEVEAIQESFSDEVSVSVDPHDPDTGVIVPRFKDGDGEEYRYLMVPVREVNNE